MVQYRAILIVQENVCNKAKNVKSHIFLDLKNVIKRKKTKK